MPLCCTQKSCILEGLIDKFKTVGKGGFKSFVKNAVLQGVTEASEETATEIANILSDDMVMGSLSNINQMRAQGMSEAQIFGELSKQVGLAGLGGFLMGVVGGGVASVGSALRQQTENRANATAEKWSGADLEPYTQEEMSKMRSLRNEFIGKDNTLKEFIDRALKRTDSTFKRIYVGKVSEGLAEQIKAQTGNDISGYNVTISNDTIRKIIKDHGDSVKEPLRGQIPVTDDMIALIPQIIGQPDNITSGYDSADGKPSLIFEKDIGGYAVAVEYVSDKHHNLDTKTFYVKKRKPVTVSDAQGPRQKTPMANSDTASVQKIAQEQQNVNSQNLSNADIQQAEANVRQETTQPLFREPLKRNERYNFEEASDHKDDTVPEGRVKRLVEQVSDEKRKTLEQWLNVAKQIGMMAAEDGDDITSVVYSTWEELHPNRKERLNRQGQRYVEFTVVDWRNAIVDAALDTNPASGELLRWDSESGQYEDFESFWWGRPNMSEREAWNAFTGANDAPANPTFGQNTVGAAETNPESYSHLQNEHGTVEPGENPARVVDMPKKDAQGQTTSRFARTAAESSSMPNSMVNEWQQAVASGEFSHEVMTDKDATDSAERKLEKGWDWAMDEWNHVVEGERVADKKDIALGQLLLANAMKDGDTATAMRLLPR